MQKAKAPVCAIQPLIGFPHQMRRSTKKSLRYFRIPYRKILSCAVLLKSEQRYDSGHHAQYDKPHDSRQRNPEQHPFHAARLLFYRQAGGGAGPMKEREQDHGDKGRLRPAVCGQYRKKLRAVERVYNALRIHKIVFGAPQEIIGGHAEEIRKLEDRGAVRIGFARFII